MPWLFFAIVAPALYGVTNFMDRFLIEKRVKYAKNLSVFGGVLFVFGAVMLIARGFPTFNPVQMAALLLAGTLTTIALIPWYKALERDETSRVAPTINGIIPVLTIILAYLFLGERLTTFQIFGSLFALVGGLILAIQDFSVSIVKVRRSFWYVLLAGLLFTIPVLIFKAVVVNQDFWNSVSYEFVGTGIGAAIIYAWLNKREFWEDAKSMRISSWAILLSDEGIYIIARICTFYAITLAPVALVSVLGSVQPFFLLLFGIILSIWFPHIIKEDIRKSTIALKLVAILLTFIGIYFINT